MLLKSNIYQNKGGAVTPPGKEIYGYNRIALSKDEEQEKKKKTPCEYHTMQQKRSVLSLQTSYLHP